jgi:hypothetical protein
MSEEKFRYSEQYKREVEEKLREIRKHKEVLNKLQKDVERYEKGLKKEYKGILRYFTAPKYVRILKILVIIVVFGIIAYLIAANFLLSQEFTYFYDIGSETDARSSYLSPLERVSEISDNTRNLSHSLVYLNALLVRGAESIKVQTRLKENFPVESKIMNLGAKDKQEWHYYWKPIYSDSLYYIDSYEKKDNVYGINDNLPLLNEEELKNQQGIVIATNEEFSPSVNVVSGYRQEETIINTSLRGGHTFYIYASGNLKVEVKKQDINWYDGEDSLEISLLDLNDDLIANTTIPDDGIVDNNKLNSTVQSGILEVQNINVGIYKLQFSDFDGLITEIKLNTNKITSDKLFLADNIIYKIETKNSSLYTKLSRSTNLRLLTYHYSGIQNISINGNETFDFYREDKPLSLNLGAGEYNLTFPENDIIVSGPAYFAFSKEQYFEPFKQKVIPIPNDFEYIKNNVDYVITDYKPYIKDGNGWAITETNFNIKEDELYVKDNQLSLVFDTPHLGQDDYQNYVIPIDWIKIIVYKPGLLEKAGITNYTLKFSKS